jgi:hypothetical protein
MIIRLKDNTIRAKNPANMAAVGRRNIKTVSFPLFTNIENVSWATHMVMTEASYPLAVINLTLGRKAFQLKPGDLFILNYAPYSISGMVVRVLSIEEENLDSERFIVSVMEDINYVATAPEMIATTGQAESLDLDIEDFTHFVVMEPPYITNEWPNYVIPIVARETGNETHALIYVSVDGGSSYTFLSGTKTFAVHGVLTEAMGASDDSCNVEITLDAGLLSSDNDAHTKQSNLILIDQEVMSFKSIEAESDGTYTISDLDRGLFGTTVDDHDEDASVYARLEKLAKMQCEFLTVSETYYFKAIPRNSQQVGELADATPAVLAFRNLSTCPLPVLNLDSEEDSGGNIVLTWTPQTRWGDTPTALWECDGLFEVAVYDGSELVRTAVTTDSDPFWNEWTYTAAMLEDDFGSDPPEELAFEVVNFIDSLRRSLTAEVIVELSS